MPGGNCSSRRRAKRRHGLQSDETCTLTAWAVNDDDEIISPVAMLKLHLLNRTVTLSVTAGFQDYLNATAVNAGTLIATQFTVLK